MAPLKPVKALFDSCLDSGLKVIQGIISENEKNLTPSRKHLLGMLHGGIREQLIDRAVSNSSLTIFEVFNIIEILADSTIKKLILKRKGDFLTGFHREQLYSIIEKSDMVGLHELQVKVKVERSFSSEPRINRASFLLHKALERGLAGSLRVLTLHNVADNLSLKILGQHAIHLTHLDITSSWFVDDIGIGDLLLKDASELINTHVDGAESLWAETSIIESLASLPKSQSNPICSSLQEVKIQDTNTTSVSVLLLLMFCSALKSLGGFLYYRNIGDAVLSVQSREGAPATLELRELWDTYLPLEKLTRISGYLPNLSRLYTRAAWLPQTPGLLPPLSNLTVDFDFIHYGPVIYPYLSFAGESLRKLTLIDQVYRLDISQIGRLCPNLEDLTAKVCVEDVESEVELRTLQTAKLRISDSGTFMWIMKHAPNMLRFESLFEFKQEGEVFDNGVILQLVQENPPSLRSIKHLSIFNDPNFMVRCGTPTIEAAYSLCEACERLEVLGELHTWINLTREDVNGLVEHIKRNNWAVQISYKDVSTIMC